METWGQKLQLTNQLNHLKLTDLYYTFLLFSYNRKVNHTYLVGEQYLFLFSIPFLVIPKICFALLYYFKKKKIPLLATTWEPSCSQNYHNPKILLQNCDGQFKPHLSLWSWFFSSSAHISTTLHLPTRKLAVHCSQSSVDANTNRVDLEHSMEHCILKVIEKLEGKTYRISSR